MTNRTRAFRLNVFFHFQKLFKTFLDTVTAIRTAFSVSEEERKDIATLAVKCSGKKYINIGKPRLHKHPLVRSAQ